MQNRTDLLQNSETARQNTQRVHSKYLRDRLLIERQSISKTPTSQNLRRVSEDRDELMGTGPELSNRDRPIIRNLVSRNSNSDFRTLEKLVPLDEVLH